MTLFVIIAHFSIKYDLYSPLLNVLHHNTVRVKEIIRTNRYDGANVFDTETALNTMKTAHNPLPSDVDLHHALLGRAGIPAGGLAIVGVVCDAESGFGVSSGGAGNMASLDGSMYWDIAVFAHEIG